MEGYLGTVTIKHAQRLIQDSQTKSVHHVQVVDDKGKQHQVLLRSFVHGHGETMYLLDRLAPLLRSANAQPGDMLMLSRDEDGPVVNPASPRPSPYQPAYVYKAASG